MKNAGGLSFAHLPDAFLHSRPARQQLRLLRGELYGPLRNYMESRLKPSPVLAGALDAAPQLGITIPGRDLHLAYTGHH